MSSVIDAKLQDLLARNREFAKTWQNPVMMAQLRDIAKQSQSAGLVLTCLDPRCVPENFFHVGSDLGLGAIRNAGGRATADAIRSIVALRTLADIRAVFVVHHTDCGMTHMTNAQIIEDVKKRTPGAANAVNALVGVTGGFGCFTEVEFEETIKEDVRILRGEKMLEGVEIRGLAFDIRDGVVRVVE